MSGSIKLTVPSFVVLSIVKTFGEVTPYQMKVFAAASIDNFRPVKHAQLYSEPDRLADAGYLSVKREESGRRRKLYRITPAGTKAVEDWLKEPAESKLEVRDEAMLKIFFGADPIPIAQQCATMHEQTLAELEQTLAAFCGVFMPSNQRLMLRAGIEIRRAWASTWRAIADGELTGDPDE